MDIDTAPLSANEGIKTRSRGLRGTIADGLGLQETGGIADDDQQLVKFHGLYLQDDRDLRAERGKQRMEKAFSFMARLRIPAGELTPAQWLAADAIARERGNGTLRITTRQTIQYHGILKGNLRPAMRALRDAMLDTIAACGDVNRNVIASAAPWDPAGHAAVSGLANAIAARLLPKTRAWHEIWLGDAAAPAASGTPPEDDPIYGATYLPRKFKIGVALPPLNDVDAFAQDLAFVAVREGGRVVGWNVVAGGGMGMTHGEPETYPRNGDIVGFVPDGMAPEVAEAVLTVQRDFGNRSNRKQARLKYTIDRMGLDVFRATVESRMSAPFDPPRPAAFDTTGDRVGWVEGTDGLWHFGVHIENGRVFDGPARRLASGLRAVAALGIGRIVMTPNQSLILADIPPGARAGVDAVLAAHGIANPAGGLRRGAVACVALPTCGLALAESERFLPDVVSALEPIMAREGLAEEEVTIRMTGCPNGCARPYMSEIGLVGRSPGRYNLYLGGARHGTRLSKLHRSDLDLDGIIAALDPLLAAFAAGRAAGESFGDWTIRAGVVARTLTGLDFHSNIAPEARS